MMASDTPAAYDTIGVDYARLRRPDPRIAVQIKAALGAAKTVINVGAGTGSYEPADCDVTALEPSAEMIRQLCITGPTRPGDWLSCDECHADKLLS